MRTPSVFPPPPWATASICAAKAYDAGWGGIVFKTIGPKNFLIDEVSPRFAELTKEGTPFVGFKNMEQIAEHPLEQNLDDLREAEEGVSRQSAHRVHYGAGSPKTGTELARLVTDAGADMIEMNLSCPQMTTARHGLRRRHQPRALPGATVRPSRRGTKLPVLAKMTPNITDMVPVAKACMEGGADGIAAINTVKSITDRRSRTALSDCLSLTASRLFRDTPARPSNP